jgi:hypothetical protein
LVGRAPDVTVINNCYALGNVLGDDTRPIGGSSVIAGGLVGKTNAAIQYCFAKGAVEAKKAGTGTGQTNTGGIIGYIDSGVTVKNCVALNVSIISKGNISPSSSYRNRVIGSNQSSSGITAVCGNNFAYDLTVVGHDNDYWGIAPSAATVSGGTHNNENGLNRTSTQLKDPAFWAGIGSYTGTNGAGFDFYSSGIWNNNIVTALGYPRLAWE